MTEGGLQCFKDRMRVSLFSRSLVEKEMTELGHYLVRAIQSKEGFVLYMCFLLGFVFLQLEEKESLIMETLVN